MSAPLSSADGSADGQVALFSACPDEADGVAIDKLMALLDETERSRLERLRDCDARRQYVVAHALLRAALSSLAPLPPSAWAFDYNPWGQPIIRRPASVPALHFSLAHTRTFALCAVCATAPVGVDAEWMEPGIPSTELTEQVLSAEERRLWLALDPARRREWFYKLWTLKESVLKAAGRGLSLAPATLRFDFAGSAEPMLRQVPTALGSCDAWQTRLLAPAPGVAGALAIHATAAARLQVIPQPFRLADLLAC